MINEFEKANVMVELVQENQLMYELADRVYRITSGLTKAIQFIQAF
jgi:hypothetical protein